MLFRFTPHLDEDLEGEHECADGGEEAEPEGGARRHAALVHAGEDSGNKEAKTRLKSLIFRVGNHKRFRMRSQD